MKPEHGLLWFDLETTGLDLGSSTILEVGWVLTDLNLVMLHDPQNRYPSQWEPHPDFLKNEEADDFVRQMHTASGLWTAREQAIETGQVWSLKEIQRQIIQDCRTWLTDDAAVTLAGSGVSSYDLPLIRRDMPDLLDVLTYYTHDISQVERFLQVRLGSMRGSSKSAVHRVIPDIQHSLKVAKVIRKHIPESLVSEIMEELQS